MTAPAGSSQVTVQERGLRSAVLSRETLYSIVLPAGYEGCAARYPVLYLLHGWNGDHRNWITLTALVRYAAQYPMIVVTPNGQNSWYVNAETSTSERFHDHIVPELITEVDAQFRTIAAPHRRAIAGLSMGGYGAVLFALKHPDLFGVAGSISGAFDAPRGIESVLPDVLPSIGAAFGVPSSTTRRENDVFELVKQAPLSPLPYFYLCCGASDPLAGSNRRFIASLAAHKILFEYHEQPGEHTWQFWDDALPPLLDAVAKRIAR